MLMGQDDDMEKKAIYLVLASPSSAEELRKHLTESNAFRILESEEAER